MSVKIIAEIGINHRGDLDMAFDLIDQAVSAGCWGVKFQYRDLESFYHASTEIGDGIILEELERVSFSVKQFIELANYAHKAGIKVGVSFFRIHDFDSFSCAAEHFDFFKVPSAECTNLPLLQTLLATNKQVMVSTGGHTLDQIEKTILPLAGSDLVVFHCVANYPAKLGAQNLNFLTKLSQIGFSEVGYSSHDEDIEVCLIAMSMGIGWVERHLTPDVHGKGLDDSSSSEVKDFHLLNKFSNTISTVMGESNKIINQGEILNMQNLGTGLYLSEDMPIGSIITMANLEVKAPRIGLSVGSFLNSYANQKTTRFLSKGEALEARSFDCIPVFDAPALFKFAKSNGVGIPVRLHDFSRFKKLLTTGVYEFHLSYQECMSGDFNAALKFIDQSDQISIHLPDYIPGNNILDPVSDDVKTKDFSRKLIFEVIDFAESIRQKTGKEIPIVGSFSQKNGREKKVILDDLFSFLDENRIQEFQILPQWLPVFAWYFGGAVKLDLFNSLEDINYLIKYNRSICLDICHLGLSANYADANWKDWYDLLSPLSKHIHLADAIGVDGEGLPLGEGDIGDFSRFLNCDALKIIEVWQGHFNEGEGFMTALDTLKVNSTSN